MNFTSLKDIADPEVLLRAAADFKKDPYSGIGRNKVLGLIFFNPSLRTRMSTQKAAYNLGMQVMVMNVDSDGWKLEMQDGAVMNGSSQEHIKDAVQVMSSYCDILGVRTFPGLKNAGEDYAEPVLNAFLKYSRVPVISLESATLHPLQSLTDIFTIAEQKLSRPKIAMTWAPHPRVLPQAVPNSFLEWVNILDAEVILAHPEGYALHPQFTRNCTVTHNQKEALEGADIVYTKNWSSYEHYGSCPEVKEDWTITTEKMAWTKNAGFMHCLPIRRNVIAIDEVIDHSIVYEQAANRVWAAQAVLAHILRSL